MNHKHWYIQAFKRKIKMSTRGFTIDDFVEVQVEALDEKEAIAISKEIIKRKHYRVFKVWDCEQSHELQQDTQLIQLQLLSKLSKQLR